MTLAVDTTLPRVFAHHAPVGVSVTIDRPAGRVLAPRSAPIR